MKLKKLMINRFVGHMYGVRFLDCHLPDIFPALDIVAQSVKALQNKDIAQAILNGSRIVADDFLPASTRDHDWLEVYVGSKFKAQNLTYDTIREYIDSSPKFDAARRQYEENLVRCYLDEYKDYRNDDFYTEAKYKYLLRNSVNYDKIIRNEVTEAMKTLGVHEKSIELSLEKNAPLWRDEAMTVAFLNRYPDCGMADYVRHGDYPVNERVIDKDLGEISYYTERAWRLLPQHKLSEHQKALYNYWKALREYEYYHTHKKTIDKLGTATPNMKMTKKEAKALFFKFQALEKVCGYGKNKHATKERC